MPIVIDEKTYTVPGAYGAVEVINLATVALPAFNNLVIIGSAKQGIPYNATGKKGYEVIKPFTSLNAARQFYGNGDLVDGIDYAKRGGAGVVYGINVASVTQASATIPDNEDPAVDAFDVKPRDRFWGVPGNDITIEISTDTTTTVTITPPKFHRYLTADAAVDNKEIKLDSISGLFVGQTVLLVDNAAAAVQSTKITAINTNNKSIEVADNPDAAYATAQYARLFIMDDNNKETKTFAAGVTVTDIIDWINTGKILTAERGSYTGIAPTTLAETYLGLITGATKAVSPDADEAASGDFDSLAADLPQLLEEFTNYTNVRLRLFSIISNDSAVHAVYKTLAQTLRSKQYSIQVIVGCASGDIDLAESNANHPIQRAKILNSDDVILVGDGCNDLGSYISKAPLVAGMMSANSVKRNLTNDSLNILKTEKFFGKSNSESETAKYLAAGVLVTGTGKNGYYIVQGVNTYQNQATVWNADDKKTYLIMQRQIVDYVYEGYRLQMETGVGADGYDETAASSQGLGILAEYAAGGFITDYAMLDAYREGNAVYTEPQITPLEATDFVGFTLKVLIPN